ncbi:hypothetical protein JOD57_001986 [Geodermatophilus bullaregiensis]|uniref:hypothetical protein n=1 Tax=Geodermatophilus bullaregiensis TaxID=1564160 RepID=UPI0027DC4872|nr:hypothetical protein [Geodermatophilus bullaregiensis]MBM7806149.1 hypothetical protein [Geodermatophilus bullaregiensis]
MGDTFGGAGSGGALWHGRTGGDGGPRGPGARESGDTASLALEQLLHEIDRCAVELQGARERAEQLLAERRAGHSRLEIVSAEARPLVVERITTVLSALSGAGSSWRRAQARALQDERVSTDRIASLFGVTRQRVSALLREGSRTEAEGAADEAAAAG